MPGTHAHVVSALSGVPLQSLSLMEVQSRAPAVTAPVQAPQTLDFLSVDTVQLWEPALQGPLPSLPGWVLQTRVAPEVQPQTESTVLSGDPSQSLSAAEVQSRAAACTAPLQSPQLPPVQVWIPRLQIPTAAAGPQAWVVPATQVHPSLGTPLQLSSLPGSQVSFAAGATPPEQVPHVLVFLSVATAQL